MQSAVASTWNTPATIAKIAIPNHRLRREKLREERADQVPDYSKNEVEPADSRDNDGRSPRDCEQSSRRLPKPTEPSARAEVIVGPIGRNGSGHMDQIAWRARPDLHGSL